MKNSSTIRHNIRSICVFAGTVSGSNNNFTKRARDIGEFIGSNNISLIYGGGSTGIMGAVAKSALKAGGHVTGVLPKCMKDREDTLTSASELFFENSMHQRKQKMYDLADAFLVLPGGIGTLDETIEVLTWLNLGIHNKPLFLFDSDGYWYPMLRLIDHMIDYGFICQKVHSHLIHIKSPEEILLTEAKIHSNNSILKPEQIKHLSPYSKAYVLQESAAKVGFDWKNTRDAFSKVDEEKQELEEELKTNNNHSKISEEYGDLLFATINLARHLNVDPQKAVNMACDKFVRRFSKVEDSILLAKKKLSLEDMLACWNNAKKSDQIKQC